jgi:hypothetical protein
MNFRVGWGSAAGELLEEEEGEVVEAAFVDEASLISVNIARKAAKTKR